MVPCFSIKNYFTMQNYLVYKSWLVECYLSSADRSTFVWLPAIFFSTWIYQLILDRGLPDLSSGIRSRVARHVSCYLILITDDLATPGLGLPGILLLTNFLQSTKGYGSIKKNSNTFNSKILKKK